jgi:hypothetical protein
VYAAVAQRPPLYRGTAWRRLSPRPPPAPGQSSGCSTQAANSRGHGAARHRRAALRPPSRFRLELTIHVRARILEPVIAEPPVSWLACRIERSRRPAASGRSSASLTARSSRDLQADAPRRCVCLRPDPGSRDSRHRRRDRTGRASPRKPPASQPRALPRNMHSKHFTAHHATGEFASRVHDRRRT